MNLRDWPTACCRCGDDLGRTASTMSRFNRDVVCIACEQDEREAPGYGAAHRAEAEAVRGGDYNFRGVGLSNADRQFLAERRLARGVTR